MNSLLEIKESLMRHIDLERSRTEFNFDECFACAYRPDGEDTCETLRPLCEDALNVIEKLEPRILKLSDIKEGEGYWLSTTYSGFKDRPVICIHIENDAQKPYITLAWQYGTFSWETETYGLEWDLWSAKPIDEHRW